MFSNSKGTVGTPAVPKTTFGSFGAKGGTAFGAARTKPPSLNSSAPKPANDSKPSDGEANSSENKPLGGGPKFGGGLSAKPAFGSKLSNGEANSSENKPSLGGGLKTGIQPSNEGQNSSNSEQTTTENHSETESKSNQSEDTPYIPILAYFADRRESYKKEHPDESDIRC